MGGLAPHRAARHRRHRGGDRPGRASRTTPTGRRCWPSPSRPSRSPGWRTSSRSPPSRSASASGRPSPAVLQSTLGNLPELFVVIFALRAGEVVVAQTSIVGSMFANALLVLGLVIVFGARNAPTGRCASARGCPTTRRRCCWSPASSSCSSGSPTRRTSRRRRHEREVSAIAAVCLLGVYLTWVVPYVRSATRSRRSTCTRPRSRSPSRSSCWRPAARRGVRVGMVHRRAAADDDPGHSPRRSPAW